MSDPMDTQIRKALGLDTHKNNVRDYFYCVKEILTLYNTRENLEKLVAREDADTICAFDHYKMKDYALNGQGLQYKEFHKEELEGIKVPKL